MPDFKHSHNRRCKGHDYRSRCIYMITILKSPQAPVFSSITQDPRYTKVSPIVKPTSAGEVIGKCLNELCNEYPNLTLLNRVVMPDHIHFELFVMDKTQKHLGSMIAAFKSNCTVAYNALFPESSLASSKWAMFQPGFNDKIAFRAGAKDAFYNYIADNPRRYLVKKLYPDYFFHNLQIDICGRKCGLYGNIFLLDNPVKSFVKISREKSRTPNLDSKIKEWEETIRCGGVLVSPFINPEEKRYRDKAVEEGTGIILIVDYRFSDRKKPYKELFDLCSEGRLLIISTEEYSDPPKAMRYSHAQELNAIAAQVADLQPCSAKLRRR